MAIRAQLVCEELLGVLKKSKLNYLVKETPYSAFVTIRKRFLKDNKDIPKVTLAQNDTNSVRDLNAITENYILKQRCKDLEVKVGYLQIDIENLEVKVETLEIDKAKMFTQVQSNEQENKLADDKINALEKDFNKKKEEFLETEDKRKFLRDQYKKLKLKFDNLQNGSKEAKDNIEILESVLKNREAEIVRLRSELDPILTKLQDQNQKQVKSYSCEHCNFETESEKGIKIHTGKMHEVHCSSCNETFAGDLKLKTHMCRMYIENPSNYT